MSSFSNKRILYVVSQGLVTAMSAVIVVVLSSYGDSANVVKFGVYFSILAVLQSTLSLRYELGLYTDGGRNERFRYCSNEYFVLSDRHYSYCSFAGLLWSWVVDVSSMTL